MSPRNTLRAGTVALLSLLPALAATAQDARDRVERVEVRRIPGGGAIQVYRSGDSPRAVLGLSLSVSGSARDTLGILVSSVTAGGPAEKAGIEEGSRIQAINGVNVRVAAADAGDVEMSGIAHRRLMRELAKAKPGDDVELRLWTGGQVRTVRVKTADADEFYRKRAATATTWSDDADRPWIGLGFGSNGSRRDTLGVLVTFVDDSGPAAKAGIYEGARIAEVNGVSLRVAKEDVDDDFAGGTRVSRLQRELRKLKAGDNVTLRVYQDGQYRNVTVKTVKMSEAPRRRGMTFFRDGGVVMPAMPPMPPRAPMAPMVPDLNFEGLRRMEMELPRLQMQLEGMRERVRTLAPAAIGTRRLIVSV